MCRTVVVVLRNSGRITLSVLSLTLSVIVTCWMGWLAVDRGFPENADPSRIYLGTDTHAMGLLLGASLGALLNSTVSCSRPGVFVGGAKFNSSFLDALGLMCFGILCTLMQVVNESNQFLYLGGFLLTSTASILLILSVADGRTKCGRVLSRQPFRWVGQRSYGLYLWHWPVYALLRPKYELIDDPAISLAIRLGLTAFIAECSYRFVEDPIRSGRCVNWGRSTKLAFMVTAFISTLSAATFFFQSSTLPAVPTEIADAINGTEASIASKQFVENGGKLAEDVAIQKMQSLPASSDGRLLTVIGDSVMLGMRDYFTRNFEGVGVDAEVGRQGSQGLKRVLELKANGQLAPNVIVQLGTNGYLTETHIRSLLNELADRRSVLLVNVHASRRWTVSNNEMLERVYPDFQNVRLLNWDRLSSDHTEYFVSDGIHLSAVGIQAMAKLITDSIDMPRSKSGVRSVVQVNRPITSLKVGAETGGIAIEVVPAITPSVSTSQASQSDPEIKPSTVDGSILNKDLIIRRTYERLVAKRELEMQYAGDDEIVRCRMGIPISRRLRDQRNFQTWNRYLIEANGDERKAFAMFYEFDCKNR